MTQTLESGEYVEPARTYLSTAVMGGFFAFGFGVDALMSAAVAHVVAWLGATAIVLTIDALTVAAARKHRSLVITADSVAIGTDVLARDQIHALAVPEAQPERYLGRLSGQGPPPGTRPVALQLVDGTVLAVPTRRPDELVRLLSLGTERDYRVREATSADDDVIAAVRERADTLFLVAGLPERPAPHAADELELLVSMVAGDPVVGILQLRKVDDRAHLGALAVLPGEQRHGVASALLTTAQQWAADNEHDLITTTTFASVPWCAPFLRRRGFVGVSVLTDELTRLRERERELGWDAVAERVVLAYRLT